MKLSNGMKQSMHLLTSSLTNEWFTPPQYADAAREVMGSIDLDPASNEIANKLIRAERYFTIEDDGLSQPWIARTVFLNPPYGRTGNKSNQEIWIRKMLHEYVIGNFEQGIILTKAIHGYIWFDWLFHDIKPTACITRGRIAFIKSEWIKPDGSIECPKGKDGRSKVASVFWYIGEDDRKFTKVFSRFGRVISSTS